MARHDAGDETADLAEDLAADDAMADAFAAREPDSDLGVQAPLLTVAEMLRTARHFADLSQRELATRVGVPKSVVGDLESEKTQSPGYRLVERLLAGCALRLVLVDPSLAVPVFPRPYDGERDVAGRHFRGHLDVRPVRSDSDWWFSRLIPGVRMRPTFTADWSRNQGRTRVRRSAAERRAVRRARATRRDRGR